MLCGLVDDKYPESVWQGNMPAVATLVYLMTEHQECFE